jgi:hypothetical protein
VFRVSSVNTDNETSLTALGSGATYKVTDGGSIVAGDIELKVEVDARVSSSDFNLTITNLASTGSGVMRRIYTENGLRIYLPYDLGTIANGNSTTPNKGDFSSDITVNSTMLAGYNNESWYLYMDEQDKDQALANGGQIRLTLTPRSATDDTIHVSAVTTNGTTGSGVTGASFGTGSDPTLRVESTDDYVGYVPSELATKIDWDKSGDEQTATLTYHGEEAYGKVYVTSTDSSGTTTQLGTVPVKDTEVTTVSSKNLIVVGGSCVNSVAASLLGGAYCGSDFTANTGVGSGQFLIKSYNSPYSTGKTALLVAGYEAADTSNAATYLTTQTVDTSKAYKGTSGTSAELVTESA